MAPRERLVTLTLLAIFLGFIAIFGTSLLPAPVLVEERAVTERPKEAERFGGAEYGRATGAWPSVPTLLVTLLVPVIIASAVYLLFRLAVGRGLIRAKATRLGIPTRGASPSGVPT